MHCRILSLLFSLLSLVVNQYAVCTIHYTIVHWIGLHGEIDGYLKFSLTCIMDHFFIMCK